MKKTDKREIKESVAHAVTSLLDELKITQPSRKTKKVVLKASKALNKELKGNLKKEQDNLKKLAKKAEKEAKAKSKLNGKAKKAEKPNA